MDCAMALGYTAPFKACNNELGGCSFNSCHSETSAHNTAKAETNTAKAETNSQVTPNDGPVNNNDNMAKANNNHPSTDNQERINP